MQQEQTSYSPRFDINTVCFSSQADPIKFYGIKEDYGCFSNFSAHPIALDELIWPTTEHYFQAMKFRKPTTASVPTSPEEAMIERIRKDSNPARAKSLGRKRSIEIRADWEAAKIDVMMDALLAKFRQHPEPCKLLLSTGDAMLVEHTTRDSEWADKGDGTGKNLLGKCLMKAREIIREESQDVQMNELQADVSGCEKAMTKKQRNEIKQKRKEEKRRKKIGRKEKEDVHVEDSADDDIDETEESTTEGEEISELAVEETEESNEQQEDQEENQDDQDQDDEDEDQDEQFLTGEQWAHLTNLNPVQNHNAVKHRDRKAAALQVREQRKRRVNHKRNIFVDAQGHSLIQREVQTSTTHFMGIRPVSLDDELSIRSSSGESRPKILIPESALPSQAKVVVTRHQFKRRFINEEESDDHDSEDDWEQIPVSHDQSVSSFFSAETAAIAQEAEMISDISRRESQQSFREETIQLSPEECADRAEIHAVMLSDLLAEKLSGGGKRTEREGEMMRERCLVLSELLSEHTNYLICSEEASDMVVLEKVLHAVDVLSPFLSD